MYGYLFAAMALAGFAAATLPINQDAVAQRYELQRTEQQASDDEVQYVARAIRNAIQDGGLSAPSSGRLKITDLDFRTTILGDIAPIREGNRGLPGAFDFYVDSTGEIYLQAEDCDRSSCMILAKAKFLPGYVPADQYKDDNISDIEGANP